MGDSVANAMGQGPITIITGTDGQDYILAPLRMKDMGTAEQFCKIQHRKDGLDFIREAGDLLSPEERQQMLKQLREEVTGSITDVLSGAATGEETGWTWMKQMSSFTVIEHVIVLRLMNAQPDLTVEQATDIVTVEAITNMEEDWSSLLGLDAFSMGEDAQGEVQGG